MNDQNFWTQSWWQGVSGVVTIVSLIVAIIAIFIAIKQNKKKRLSFKVIYADSLIAINKDFKNDLKITYKGYEVDQIQVVKLRIINNGQIPVKKEDFEDPIIIEFADCKNLFTATKEDSYPANLKFELQTHLNKIIINPILINPNEYFTIQATFEGMSRIFSVSSRIEGISVIGDAEIYQKASKIALELILAALVSDFASIATSVGKAKPKF